MKKYLFPMLLFALFAVGFTASDDDDTILPDDSGNTEKPTEPTSVVLNDYSNQVGSAVVYNEGINQFIADSITDGTLITFSKEIPREILPEVGTVFYIPASEKVPYGFLGKVSSIEVEDVVKIHTESAPLDELFRTLSVDTTITVIKELEGIYDVDGNPLDYEIVDTADMNLEDTTIVSQARSITRAHEDFTWDFDWKKQSLKFPVKLYEGKSGKDKIEISGVAYLGFKKFDFDIDINNNIELR